jgi:hypothetical protein
VREAGRSDLLEVEEIFDLARFTDHGPLRAACLSRLKCNVTISREPQHYWTNGL